MVYGQKTTGQKTTENANPGQNATQTKDHHHRNFVFYVEEVYNELFAFKKLREVPVISAEHQHKQTCLLLSIDLTILLACIGE